MMQSKPQKIFGCALVLFSINLLMIQQSSAELSTVQGAPINNLYDNLLQREYAGPIVFPNHQVERKAQRSPSLRLRFGRSDPDMLNNIVEKRWFGDVNQKPIRSPSLRLRFGRRSDPNLPQMRRTAYDDLLERELTLNSQQVNKPATGNDAVVSDDDDAAFERMVRNPQRLRWLRSIMTNILDQDKSERHQLERDQLEREWLNVQELSRMLLAQKQQYEKSAAERAAIDAFYAIDSDEDQDENNSEYQFQREARKPMRLRWGRSTGKAPAEQKMPLAAETASVAPKSQN
ncbi:short neuropeptide F [Drosophila grimshawi]|uniref:GH13655 n=1 Tax=Drosophila grimshawi TaxID=7222 RepID=B4JQ85_DROGR|nr:short neuropeptide F [Drosophila grimshawi]EDV99065.1 GH13655 [Drosophila grimshawi]